MDNQRLFLYAALAMVLFMIYQAWVQDYGPKPQVANPAATSAVSDIPTDGVETGVVPNDLPSLDAIPETVEESPVQESVPQAAERGRRVRVTTDVLDLELDLTGGDLRQAKIVQYPIDKKSPDRLVTLLDDSPQSGYVVQSGLLAAAEWSGPNHRTDYVADAQSYTLSDAQDELKVALTWADANGLSVEKIYTFKRGEYAVNLEYRVNNASAEAWQAAPYIQLQRIHRKPKRSMTDVDTYSFTGPVFYNGDKYEKLDVDDLAEEPIAVTANNGWLAVIQHHFLVAVIPTADTAQKYEAQMLDGNRYLLRAIGPSFQVAGGQQASTFETLFVGPKLQDQMKKVGNRLELTVDYGIFTIISQPLFWLLDKIHSVVKNWGWAIILLTVLIKLLFYKLAETSGRSMAKMRKLQPRLKSIQERYKDDREKLSRSMMELYKTEKVNPAAGCLPILVQMPVFLALYWVLLESVELRQAPFALWINDLSVRDPYFILPVLMGASMFFMQKLNPQPTDPVQAKVMTILPLVMSVFMAFFPAGLVLYWLVNNLLSIAQQWRINKVVAAER